MQCPKCGTEQPNSDACIHCQIIIAKYLQRQAEQQYAEVPPSYQEPESAAGSGGFPVVKILLLLVIITGVGGGFWWAKPFAPKMGEYDATAGHYKNDRLKFELTIPAEWNTYALHEAISCPTINRERKDDYFLLASPTNPDHMMIVVDVSGIELEYQKKVGWAGVVDFYNEGHPVSYTSVDEVGGIELHRVGYYIRGAYRENAIFETNGKLIEIYFYVNGGVDAAWRIADMRQIIDNGLQKL